MSASHTLGATRSIATALLLMAVACALAAASVAYACTPNADIAFNRSIADGKAPAYRPDTIVRVTGYGFDPQATRPVSLHWGTNEPGPVIATAAVDATGRIATSFKIPASTAPGTYIVYALGYDASGNLVGYPRNSLRVVARAPAATRAPTPPVARPPDTASHPHPSISGGASIRPHAATGPGATIHRHVAAGPTTHRHVATRARTSLTAPGGSSATVIPRARSIAHVRTHRSTMSPQTPPRSRPAIPRTVAPLRVPNPETVINAPSSGAPLAIGVGLLAVGLVALFGGFALAEVRRRRAHAHRQGRRKSE